LIVVERIPIAPMKKILELAKKQTADMVLIPQCPAILSQERDWNLAGTVGGSIVSTSVYAENALPKQFGMLWRDVSIPYISLLYKDINPFLKQLNETDEHEMSLLIHQYDINGYKKGVVFGLSIGKIQQGPDGIIPHLACFPYYQLLEQVQLVRSKWTNSLQIATLWLDEEKQFQKVWKGKASDGARAWVPKSHTPGVNLDPYVMYLSKTMFVFSKNDHVTINIRDQIPGEYYNKFMAEFNVQRKAKGCSSNHQYTLMGFKL
jgi:hypothetical protein